MNIKDKILMLYYKSKTLNGCLILAYITFISSILVELVEVIYEIFDNYSIIYFNLVLWIIAMISCMGIIRSVYYTFNGIYMCEIQHHTDDFGSKLIMDKLLTVFYYGFYYAVTCMILYQPIKIMLLEKCPDYFVFIYIITGILLVVNIYFLWKFLTGFEDIRRMVKNSKYGILPANLTL